MAENILLHLGPTPRGGANASDSHSTLRSSQTVEIEPLAQKKMESQRNQINRTLLETKKNKPPKKFKTHQIAQGKAEFRKLPLDPENHGDPAR